MTGVSRRYVSGVTPVFSLKSRIKWLAFSIPTVWLIYTILLSVCSSISFALSMRILFRYCMGVYS